MQEAAGTKHVFGSRIGRRLILLFVGCSLLPLAVFAFIALEQVSARLAAEADRTLHYAAKSAGMDLGSRVLAQTEELEVAANLVEDQGAADLAARLATWLGSRFASISRVDPNGSTRLIGADPRPFPALDGRQLGHLATGKPLLHVRRGEVPLLRLLLGTARAEEFLAAELRNELLFLPENLRSGGSEVFVLTGDGEYLFGSDEQVPDLAPLRDLLLREPSSGIYRWSIGGVPHRACYWRLFLAPQLGCDFVVVQSRPVVLEFAPLYGFQWLFLFTAILTFLLVLYTSLVQIRKTLQPIAALREATQRIAAGDLDARVAVHTDDELGELGRSFDLMTMRLRESIARREATERQLVSARDEALAAARAKADFLTNVSHELRTPLTSILVYSELLDRGHVAGEEATEFMGAIAEQAQHLHRIVEQVLDLTGTTAWAPAATDLRATVRAALAELPEAGRRRITLRIAGDLPRVAGVHERLVQLWQHLIDNALRFSPEATSVELEAFRGRGAVVVRVVDHGRGIARADLQRIFDPFCQITEDMLTGKSAGVGLGLTIARNIVDRLGGSIRVDSTLGEGATFTVELPEWSADQAGAGVAAASSEPAAVC